MSSVLKGMIFNIQHFSSEDGPGIRTTVFFKGCNLHCPWCHNPESQSFQPEIMYFKQKCIGCKKCLEACPNHELFSEACLHCGKCAGGCPTEALVPYGKEMTVDEVIAEVMQDRDIYEISGGGVTISGGEPLLQIDFLEELLKLLKKENIHTAIETAGNYNVHYLERILPYTDYIFIDLKCLDEKKHTEVIGMSNRQILDNIRMLSSLDVSMVIRIPVICGFNDMELPVMADFVNQLSKRIPIELLPYHDICAGKYTALNRRFQVDGFRVPGEQEMMEFKQIFAERNR